MADNNNAQKTIKEKIARVTNNAMEYLSGIGDEHLNDFNYIPESVQPYVNKFVREGRKSFDWLNEGIDKLDKSSDEFVAMKKEIENIAKSFINVRGQIDKYKNGIKNFKEVLPNMNKGTQDSKYFLASAIFGNQPDSVEIDKFGNFSFGIQYGDKKDEWSTFKLNDVANVNGSGPASIITEPFGSKAFVWKLAEKTKADKDSGRPFDYDWTYKKVLNNLADNGPQNSIGMAFTDMAGDNSSKSFAEMYEEGLKDKSYYIHPETGETMPMDNIWMKDGKNADIVSKLMSKYITDVMKDIYGTISSGTGQVKKTQSEVARELINKYSGKGNQQGSHHHDVSAGSPTTGDAHKGDKH